MTDKEAIMLLKMCTAHEEMYTALQIAIGALEERENRKMDFMKEVLSHETGYKKSNKI